MPPGAAAASASASGGRTVLVRLVGLLAVVLGLGLRLGLELGRDEGIVLGAQVDLVVEIEAGADRRLGRLALRKIVLALELLDLLDGHLQLMSDPGVGAPLADPAADLVEMRTQ